MIMAIKVNTIVNRDAIYYSDFVQECNWCGEGTWFGDGREGEWTLGGSGHTESECIESCRAKDLCNYASISLTSYGKGYCHMTETCVTTSSGKYWARFKKKGMTSIISKVFQTLNCKTSINYYI